MNNTEWYNELIKSKFTPPSYVFQIVWPILYILIFISFILVLLNSDHINNSIFIKTIVIFVLQILCNIMWSPLFFGYRYIKIAFIDIVLTLALTALNIYYFYKSYPISAYLLIPYICWLILATYLNLYIVINN
jgi:translocator protein